MHLEGNRAGLLLAASAVAFATAATASETTSYGYDALGRLTTTTTTGTVNDGVATSTVYDPAGNRTSHGVTGSAGGPPPSPPPPPPPPGNQPPATNSDAASIPKCGTVTKNVVANDTDPEGHYPLALVAISHDGSRGTATMAGTTSIHFESDGVPGPALIGYTVRDSLGATSTGTFTVTVTTSNACP